MSLIAKTACAAAIFLALGSLAHADEPQKCLMKNIASLSLHDDGYRFSVDGSVNGDKTAMLIDSGAQNTLVTKTETAKLKLAPPAAKDKKTAPDNRVQLSELSIGGIELGNTRILASQKLSDYPSFGALVGADFLLQHDLELAPGAQQMKFFSPSGCDQSFIAYWDKDAAMVPLSSLSPTDYRPVVTVEVDGQQMRALVDTATPISVIHLAAAARLGVTPKSAGVTPMAGTHATVWVAPFHKFAIGGEEILNVKIPLLDLKNVVNADAGTATPDMILGADFLRTHHVLFAPSQKSFYFSYVGGKVFNLDSATNAGAPKS